MAYRKIPKEYMDKVDEEIKRIYGTMAIESMVPVLNQKGFDVSVSTIRNRINKLNLNGNNKPEKPKNVRLYQDGNVTVHRLL